MKVAYLIQCHKSPDQVNRMIRALTSSEPGFLTDFYVHVDKKADIAKEILHADNVVLIEDSKRVDVKWGELSLIDAALVLLRTALASGQQYDYFWFMSGQDYPVKSNAEIAAFLRENNGKIFMQGWGEEKDRYPSFLKRNQVWYPPWIVHPNNLIRILRRIYVLVTGGGRYTFPFLKRRNHGMSFVWPSGEEAYYFGSCWFTITRPCVEYILDYLDKNPKYYAFFRNTVVPDECLLLTIVFNSSFKPYVQDCLCYVDWSACKRNPKVFTIHDYDQLVRSSYLIARKFDVSVDASVLDKLDEQVLSNS